METSLKEKLQDINRRMIMRDTTYMDGLLEALAMGQSESADRIKAYHEILIDVLQMCNSELMPTERQLDELAKKIHSAIDVS